jgi:hypothetical protein
VAGDIDDFEDFYQACYGRVVALVAAMVGDRHQAEDIAQEAFARALTRWKRVARYDVPEAWVRRVALRLTVAARRRVMRRAAAATAMTAVVAAAAVGITVSLPSGSPVAGPAGGLPEGSISSWPAAPGTWTRGAWQPAGPLPAAGAGPAVAPYILIPRYGGVIQVRRVFRSVTTIATVQSPPGQYLDGVASAGDDRTFVVQAAIGGQQNGIGFPVNPTTLAFEELRLGSDGRPEPLRLLFTLPARDVNPGVFAISQDASMLAYTTSNSGFETVSLATGKGRGWPPVDSGTVAFSLSWAGDRTLAFEWDGGNNPDPPGTGIRVLDVTAPGNLLRASRLIVGYSRYCAASGGCRNDPLITPDGSTVMVSKVTCRRACAAAEVNPSGVFTDSVVEYSIRTGQPTANVAPPVTSSFPGTLCVPVWTDPSGVQVVTSCGHPELYDRGHVSRITVYMPMNGTDILPFAWQPGSPGN